MLLNLKSLLCTTGMYNRQIAHPACWCCVLNMLISYLPFCVSCSLLYLHYCEISFAFKVTHMHNRHIAQPACWGCVLNMPISYFPFCVSCALLFNIMYCMFGAIPTQFLAYHVSGILCIQHVHLFIRLVDNLFYICVLCWSLYIAFVDSGGPRNPNPLAHCDCSGNGTTQHSVVSLCEQISICFVWHSCTGLDPIKIEPWLSP